MRIADRRTASTTRCSSRSAACAQWVTIRGQDRDNPVVLVLHGGPGSAIGGLGARVRSLGARLHGRAVGPARRGQNVPRRGAQPSRPTSRSRAWRRTASSSPSGCGGASARTKIVLLGWSWGSILGVHMVKARPDLFAAYVGTGQVVAMQEGEAVAYASVLAKARQRDDGAALAELEAIGAPPYDALDGNRDAAQVGDALRARPPARGRVRPAAAPRAAHDARRSSTTWLAARWPRRAHFVGADHDGPDDGDRLAAARARFRGADVRRPGHQTTISRRPS